MDNDNEMQAATDPAEAPLHGNPAKSYRTRGLTIGVAAGLLGGAAAGFAFGVPGLSSAASPTAVVQQTPDTTPDDATPADTTPDESDESTAPDPGTRLREALQPLVDDGTITAAQADAVIAQLKESLPVHGRGTGHGGPGHRGGGVFGHIFGAASDVVTGVLGIDGDTLRTELLAGKSLADIATENGVEPQAVVDAILAEATTHLDEAVADGRIDADQADDLKADLSETVTDLVNGSLPDLGDLPGLGGFPGLGDFPGGHGRFHDESDDSDDAPATTDD